MSRLLRRKLRRDAWAMRGRIALLATVVAAGIALPAAMYQSYGDLRQSYDHMYDANQLAHVFIKLDEPRPVPENPAAALGSRGVQEIAVATTRLSLPGVVLLEGEPVQAQFIGVPEHAWPKINDVCVRVEEPWNYACTPGEKARNAIHPLGQDNAAILHAGFADAKDVHQGQRLDARILGQNTSFQVQQMGLNSEFLFPWTNPQVLVFDPGDSAILWVPQSHLERLAAPSDPADAASAPAAGHHLATDIFLRMTTGNEEAKARQVVDLFEEQPSRFDGLGIRTVEAREDTFVYAIAEADIDGFQQLSPIVAGIGLLIASITIAVTMDRLVLAQRGVIGVLRALGATPRRLVTHYLGLAILIGLMGSVAGTLVGVLGGAALSQWYRGIIGFPVLIIQPRASILLALAAVAVGACAVGGFRAALHAARIPITTAMRPPAAKPPRGWLRRATARLQLPTRLAIRNVTRTPKRAAFTLTGMSLSVVMTFGMIGLFSSSLTAIDQLLAQDTSDGLVVISPPQPEATVTQALARISWIATAEPFVEVPGLVEGMDDPILITGLQIDSLKQLSLAEGDASFANGNGVVAPATFITSVETETGRRLEVGSRFDILINGEDREVELVGIVNDLLGTTIYMPKETIQAYLGSDIITGAYLEVAGGRTARAEDLAEVPGYLDLALKEEIEASLQESLEASIQFAVLFAAIGAILGIIVILNTSAVNLQERALEHGTLKALGLSDRIIVQTLAIEHFIIGALASFIGVGLGYAASVQLLATLGEEQGFSLAYSVPASTVIMVLAAVILLAQIPTLTAIRSLRKLDLPSLVKARGG